METTTDPQDVGELERFAYIVSHDLQEQVRNITNFTGLIARHQGSTADEDFKHYLQVVTESSAILNLQLAALLAFSRIGRKQEKEPVDCNAIVYSVLENMTDIIQETRTTFNIGELPVVIGYAKELRLVFENLIANALKFRSKGSLSGINVQCRNKDTFWEFCISDNGIGINEKHFQKVFRIFQRLHSSDEFPGIGAGLALAKKAVEAHQGTIWVNAEPGNGSTFYFTLPII